MTEFSEFENKLENNEPNETNIDAPAQEPEFEEMPTGSGVQEPVENAGEWQNTPNNGEPYWNAPQNNGGQYWNEPQNNSGQYWNGPQNNGGQYWNEPQNNGGQYWNGPQNNGGQYSNGPQNNPYVNPYNPYPPKQPKKKNGFATGALFCGIFGLLSLCCFAFTTSIIMGVGAISFAIISKKDQPFTTTAIIAIVLGAIAIVLGVGEFFCSLWLSDLMKDPAYIQMFNQFMEQMEQEVATQGIQ